MDGTDVFGYEMTRQKPESNRENNSWTDPRVLVARDKNFLLLGSAVGLIKRS